MSPILQPMRPIWNICLIMRYELLYFILHSQEICLYLMLYLLSEKLIHLLPKLLESKFSTLIHERPPSRLREDNLQNSS